MAIPPLERGIDTPQRCGNAPRGRFVVDQLLGRKEQHRAEEDGRSSEEREPPGRCWARTVRLRKEDGLCTSSDARRAHAHHDNRTQTAGERESTLYFSSDQDQRHPDQSGKDAEVHVRATRCDELLDQEGSRAHRQMATQEAAGLDVEPVGRDSVGHRKETKWSAGSADEPEHCDGCRRADSNPTPSQPVAQAPTPEGGPLGLQCRVDLVDGSARFLPDRHRSTLIGRKVFRRSGQVAPVPAWDPCDCTVDTMMSYGSTTGSANPGHSVSALVSPLFRVIVVDRE